MTTSAVPVPGGRLNVVDEGGSSDPALVLLHAGIADLRSWDGLIPPLIDDGHRVIEFLAPLPRWS